MSDVRKDIQRAELERRAAIAAETRREDIRWLMESPRGRRLVWAWLSECGNTRISFAGEKPLTMAFNEGQRNIGLIIEGTVREYAADQWELMVNESKRPPGSD